MSSSLGNINYSKPPVLNKVRAKLKQKFPRSHWINYISGFISHRNILTGVWNSYSKPKDFETSFNHSPDYESNDFRQRNLNNEVLTKISELYDYALFVKKDFDEILSFLAEKNKFKVFVDDYPLSTIPADSLILPPLKTKEKIHLKAKQKYTQSDLGPPIALVNDIVRCFFSCKTFAGILK